jgi:hypothetical protein
MIALSLILSHGAAQIRGRCPESESQGCRPESAGVIQNPNPQGVMSNRGIIWDPPGLIPSIARGLVRTGRSASLGSPPVCKAPLPLGMVRVAPPLAAVVTYEIVPDIWQGSEG